MKPYPIERNEFNKKLVIQRMLWFLDRGYPAILLEAVELYSTYRHIGLFTETEYVEWNDLWHEAETRFSKGEHGNETNILRQVMQEYYSPRLDGWEETYI